VELRQIKELMVAMGRSGIRKLSYKKEGVELQLEAEGYFHGDNQDSPEDQREPFYRRGQDERFSALARGQELSAPLAHAPQGQAPAAVDASAPKHNFVTSPMVGTFYKSASPEDPSLVKIGDRVEADTAMCIIEAMKVMNEVRAGISGVVVEMLVENGHPVEFGSKLFRIE